ncbi:probable methyltransferase-like protein 24 [Physella acuta]|uniref:probable methyltransferase-like protein 24 n=1 Tax=Physella acuta TaxID=109671 RepID=UPI0027DB3FA1|nr:probable methyltransferase-like protein 24 [Physella acuta]XP_059178741.1 probable methyltransferase-like protein 24 [Physella acuta]
MSLNRLVRLLLLVVGTSLIVFLAFRLRPHVIKYAMRPTGSRCDVNKMDAVAHPMSPLQLEEDFGSGPLSSVRQKGYVTNLSSLDLDKLSTEEILMTIHSYPDNTDTLCRRKFRMGNIGDGGWEICDDPDIRPRAPCIIYSLGINFDFSFDDDAARLYGCHVYSFDPSMEKEKDQYNRSDRVHFYKIGLSGSTYVNSNKWQLYTLGDLRKKLGHQNSTIDVIKMDIESSEWEALPEMASSGELDKVRQLLLEFHILEEKRDYLLPRLKAMQAIEKSGLKIFYTHKNHACGTKVSCFPLRRSMCYEVHYLRR